MKSSLHNNGLSDEVKMLFSKSSIDYGKAKEEVWASLDLKDDVSSGEPKRMHIYPMFLRAAGMIVFMFGLGLLARFYEKNINVKLGQLISYNLPDGSLVHLNADSQLKYYPIWWWMEREVMLQGEAFFEVKKGSKFSVHSGNYATEVLGTTFNIFARKSGYEVFCATGKVQVKHLENTSILHPGDYLKKVGSNKILIEHKVSKSDVMAWRLGKFNYNTTPISKVMADVARHYDIDIQMEMIDSDIYYTGFFDRAKSADTTLKIICNSLGFSFEKETARKYRIKKIIY